MLQRCSWDNFMKSFTEAIRTEREMRTFIQGRRKRRFVTAVEESIGKENSCPLRNPMSEGSTDPLQGTLNTNLRSDAASSMSAIVFRGRSTHMAEFRLKTKEKKFRKTNRFRLSKALIPEMDDTAPWAVKRLKKMIQ
ncbi:hypothetical protein CEXT_211481 [Caerostris extrusa]|uniref:Uncharacterized protein n=1 Tax=Caerostris extrusa TaxID=172846 RepID=A0AAV4QG05_CAEEX|nr:hypothetical protein CEXT_211481 [Caerostris extrusa]